MIREKYKRLVDDIEARYLDNTEVLTRQALVMALQGYVYLKNS